MHTSKEIDKAYDEANRTEWRCATLLRRAIKRHEDSVKELLYWADIARKSDNITNQNTR